MDRIPRKIPAALFDMGVYCLRCIGDMMLNMEMEFDHHLDSGRLRRAFELALDAEPVLGCRFVFHPRKPYWMRLDPDERENFAVLGIEDEYESARRELLDITRGPQLKGFLLRGAKGDRLLMKIAHETADAGGTKRVLATVSRIYNRLADEPDYVPEPNLRGSRGLRQVLKKLPWYSYPKVLVNILRETWSNMVPLRSLNFPLEEEKSDSYEFVVRHVPAGRVKRIAEYGRARGAKINDMMLAALVRTVARLRGWKGESQLRMLMTVDLRRWYLPSGRAEAACNLSAFEYPNLRRKLGKDYESTLARVSAFTRRRKSNWIGMNMLFGLAPTCTFIPFRILTRMVGDFFAFAARSGNMASGLTNLGPIEPEAATFDKPASRCWMLVPPADPPFLVFGISGYEGTLTLSSGTAVTAVDTVGNFFDNLLSELPE